MQFDQLIDVLVDEVRSSQPQLLEQSSVLVSAEDDEAARLDAAAGHYAEFCERLAAATESIGLAGISQVASALAQSLPMSVALPRELRAQAEPMLNVWPDFLADYLTQWKSGPPAALPIGRFVQAMAAAEYLTPLDAQQQVELAALLAHPPDSATQQQASIAPFEPLDDEALSLTPSPEAGREVLDALLFEGPMQAARLLDVANRLGQGVGPELLEEAHRTAHTLKGTAAIGGVRGIATLAHALEDVLEAWRIEGFEPPPGLQPWVVAGCDQLDLAMECMSQGTAPDAAFATTARSLHAWAAHLRGADVDESWLELPGPGSRPLRAGPTSIGLLEAAETPGTAIPQPASVAEDEPHLRVPVRTLDTLFRATNELSIGLLRLRRDNDDLMARLLTQTQLAQGAQHRLRDIEEQVLVRGLGRESGHESGRGAERETGRPASHPEFDELELDHYNELTGHAQALREAVNDLQVARQEMGERLRDTAGVTQRQLVLAREALHQVTRARLRPLSELRVRMQRTVRQTAQAVGHEAELFITGDELRVDAAVLSPLADALLHLLRNAVDHGIEDADTREALGKPATGRIQVSFQQVGGGVLARIQDDGQGLDLDAILKRGIERGLVAPDAGLTAEQVGRLIFLPGFSTREAVTQTSGRGVGLDVVAQIATSLQGHVSVSGAALEGTEFRLFVMANLGTVHAMHVQVANEHYLVPSVQIEQALPAQDAPPQEATGAHLATLLHGQAQALDGAKPHLLLHVDGALHAVAVDRVIEARDFLLTPAPSLVEGIAGLTGVSSLADGGLALVLNLVDLCRKPVAVTAQWLREAQAAKDMRAHALVVDDSPSVRNTLGTLLRDAGWQVSTAVDGLDAIAQMGQHLFTAVITDLEMPQVNGLELTEFVRQRSRQPNIAVLMLTSRGQDKHRQRAMRAGVSAFLTKPYADEAVLSALAEATAAV